MRSSLWSLHIKQGPNAASMFKRAPVYTHNDGTGGNSIGYVVIVYGPHGESYGLSIEHGAPVLVSLDKPEGK